MVTFRDLTIKDKSWIDPILEECGYMSCEYCFGNHFIWKDIYEEKVARIGDRYTILLRGDEGERGTSFLYPAGTGDIKPVIEELLRYCEEQEIDFCLHSMPEEGKEELETAFPGMFTITTNRGYSDYIYTVEDLTNLSGKKYHGKRNHIARFKENDWKFEPITPDNYKDCLALNEKWCEINGCGMDPSLKDEQCAIRRCFRYFKELNLFGGLLWANGEPVAYTIAERLNANTVDVHIEKALSAVQGAYPTINREFVANMCQDYKFVNREEDLGVEGLRKAKLSYRPAIILSKYEVRLKHENDLSPSPDDRSACNENVVAESVLG